MKFKITLLILSVLFLTFICVGEHLLIKNTFLHFDEAVTYIERQEEYSLDEVLALQSWWEKRSRFLELTVSVQILNDLSYTYGELVGAVRCEDYKSASAFLDRLHSYCHRLRETYQISIENIL